MKISVSEFELDEIVSLGSVNNRCKQFNQMFPVSVANGGTGATNTAQARKNLGIYKLEYINYSGSNGTYTLSTSINNYSYIRIYYTGFSYYARSSTYFTHDIIGSTAMHALSDTAFYNYNHMDYLIFLTSLVRFSSTGLTMMLERNGGLIKNLTNGEVHTLPYTPPPNSFDPKIYQKIELGSIHGYK